MLPKDIVFREDRFLMLEFIIPEEFLMNKNKKELIDALWYFHNGYIDISQKFQIGEIIPKELLDKYNINLKTVYKDCIKYIVNVEERVPLFDSVHDELKRLTPGNCWYHLITENCDAISGYYYIDRGKARSIDEYGYKKLPSACETFSITALGCDISAIGKDEYFYEPDFSIDIYTDFWFPVTSKDWPERSYNNRYLAYHNTPRLNSYIRDLRNLWVKKCGWEFEIALATPGVSKTGEILLDGKIIYQEDVDEGRITLPRIEDYLG